MVRRINLVPRSERTRTTTAFGPLALLAVAIIVIFAIGLGYYVLNGSLADREQELANAQQQTAALDSQVAALSKFAELEHRRADTEKVVQRIYANRTPVSDILDAVSLVVPENAWFASLSLATSDPVASEAAAGSAQTAAGGVQGGGTLVIDGNTYSFGDVAQVLVRLQLVPALSGVKLVSAGTPRGATDPAQVVRGFSIDAAVVNTQPVDTLLPLSQVEVEGP